MSGCCHRIVKHWFVSEKMLMARANKKDNHLPAKSQAKFESKN